MMRELLVFFTFAFVACETMISTGATAELGNPQPSLQIIPRPRIARAHRVCHWGAWIGGEIRNPLVLGATWICVP
jgi:hypothetical protein